MINIDITGKSKDDIMAELDKFQPVSDLIPKLYTDFNHFHKREIWDYQAALVYATAAQYDRPGAQIVELGTCWGWSAYVMAQAAPEAHIKTCTPNPNHVKLARGHLSGLNVEVLETRSQDWLANYTGPMLDMIFIDGDHPNVHQDMPWWNWLKIGGLMLHHDYTPKGAPRETPPVYRELNRFMEYLGRGADVRVIDADRVGMLGWYRKEGDKPWPTQQPQS